MASPQRTTTQPIQPLYFGFSPPFLSQNGVMKRQVDERLIKNDILLLLLTVPGERIYRPGFGTQLRTILFNSLNTTDMATLAQTIQAAIESGEDRVTVNSVDCKSSDGQTISVTISVSPNGQPQVIYLMSITLNQNGSIAAS